MNFALSNFLANPQFALTREFRSTTANTFLVYLLSLLSVYILVSHFWKNRWLYYCGIKLKGPIWFPFIGSVHMMLRGRMETLSLIEKVTKIHPSPVKMWLGTYLFIFTSKPQDVELILTQALNKCFTYEFFKDYFGQSLFVAPVSIWKQRRKTINPTFNSNIIESFFPVFVEQAEVFVDAVDKSFRKHHLMDIFPEMWKCTFNSTIATLFNTDPLKLEGKETILESVFKFEDIFTKKFYNPLFHFDFFWKLSSLYRKDVVELQKNLSTFVQEIVNKHTDVSNNKSDDLEDDPLRNKRFLHHLLDLYKNGELKREYILDEMMAMIVAASESSAITMSTVLLILGMHPEIQVEIMKEQVSIIKKYGDLTLESLNSMDYLERVIKETMRIIPPVPIVARKLTKDIDLGSCTLPSGCEIVVCISQLHRDPDIWPDPLKFDPDRFLPEQVKKRERCAYIPFSYGVRNCAGPRYAMIIMKVTLAIFLRKFKVVASEDYNSIQDILGDQMFYLVAKNKKGYRIVFEKRNI